MKRLKRWTGGRLLAVFLLSLLAFAAMLGVTSAYFTDRIVKEAQRMKTARLCFSYQDDGTAAGEAENTHGIVADFTELDGKTTPYTAGEKLNVHFETRLFGEAQAIVIPCFQVETAGGEETDLLAVYEWREGKRELLGRISGTDGARAFYQDRIEMNPKEEKRFSYQIEVESRSEAPLRLSFDFGVAGIQKRRNEELSAKRSSEALYKEISARYKGADRFEGNMQSSETGREVSGEALSGFTDVCTLLRAVDQNGASADPSERIPYYTVLLPNVQPGNPERSSITWYELQEGKETRMQSGISSEGDLQLLLQKRTLDRSFRYEVQNEAGIQYSPWFTFRTDESGLLCEAVLFAPGETGAAESGAKETGGKDAEATGT